MALKKASNLTEVRRVCKAKPLEGEELDFFFVETDQARDPHQRTRKRLEAAFEIEDARVLFYGHRGCGKSTELNKFLAERQKEWFCIKFSVLDEMNIVSARAEDLILTIADRSLNRAEKEGLPLADSLLEPVLEYFKDVVKTE